MRYFYDKNIKHLSRFPILNKSQYIDLFFQFQLQLCTSDW